MSLRCSALPFLAAAAAALLLLLVHVQPALAMLASHKSIAGNTVQTGSGLYFKLNVTPGSITQLGGGGQPAATGLNRSLSIDLGKTNRAALTAIPLAGLVNLTSKSSALLLLITVENVSSPSPSFGLSNVLSVLQLNLSLGAGSAGTLGATVTPGTLLPAGVYTGNIVIKDNLLLDTIRIPVKIQLT